MMKFFIVAGRIAFFLSVMVLMTCAQTPTQKDNHSIALVLKVSGDRENISEVSMYNYTLFNGRVKPGDEKFTGDNSLHIKIKNEKDSTLFDNYLENPLTKNLESFNPDGTIERVISPRKEDFINLRFKLQPDDKQLTIYTYLFKINEDEKVISVFNLKLK